MTQQRSSYRHPRHDEIVALIEQGGTNLGIGRQLGIDKRAAARVREILGTPKHARSTTPEQKVARFLDERADRHVGWTGRRANSRVPVIRQYDQAVPASHVVFRGRAGRPPVGVVKAECGFEHCLNGRHMTDEIERRRARLIERSLHGLEAPWKVCPKGLHDWDEHGRVEPYPSLKTYCKGCNSDRAHRVRKARREEQAAS